jgi:quercetin dioxygenase-like cupin family protein
MAATLHRWDAIAPEQLTSHITRRYVTGDGATVAHFMLKKGGVVPAHAHPNEQLSCVLSGKLQFRFGEETQLVGAGEVIQIPGNLAHEVTVLEDTIVLDVFTPIRQDWVDRTDTYFTGGAGPR